MGRATDTNPREELTLAVVGGDEHHQRRERALNLVVSTDMSIRAIAREVGISHPVLLKWINQENEEYREENANRIERYRRRQRKACYALLAKWEPLATAEALAIRDHDREGNEVMDMDTFECGSKAAVIVLKTLERLAKLDGLDVAERKEIAVTDKSASPIDLAARIAAVTPLLMGRSGTERTPQGQSEGDG